MTIYATSGHVFENVSIVLRSLDSIEFLTEDGDLVTIWAEGIEEID